MDSEFEKQREERLKIIEKIKEYESLGGEYFFKDVEDDPEGKTLMPEDVDYLKKKFMSKVRNFISWCMCEKFYHYYKKKYQIKVEGNEVFSNLKTGAIVTSNHFSQYENLCVYDAIHHSKAKHRRLFFVVREGNYFMPGGIGYILKHYNTLPLSSNMHTMKNFNNAIKTLLEKRHFILIYPEQSMWWNYRKPKPFKNGAFIFAARNNVPVVPCFVTMREIEGKDELGFNNLAYTIHVMKPIYPEENKTVKENAEMMMKKNFEIVKEKYEEVYKMPLKYDGNNFMR